MSQKPKAGTPGRAAPSSKAVPKEDVMKADPAAAEPAVTADPVEAEMIEAAAEVAVPPMVEAAPEAEAVPPVVPSYSTDETMAAASAKAVSATITATADTVADVTSEAVEAASSIEPTQPTMSQGIKTMMKTTEDFVAFSQANLEAFVKSGQIWSAGVQELTKQLASSAKASFDDSVSTFKAMSTVKSVKEAMDLQSSFAKAALEKAMAESNKLTDASIKLTEQTLAPITARVTVAVETFGKAA
jgi:phasin family protein